MSESDQVVHDPKQKRGFWEEHIELWQQSGLTQLAYCRNNQLKAHQMTYWKKRLDQSGAGVAFVPLQFAGTLPVPVSKAAFKLITPNGYRVDILPGFDPATLKQLVSVVKTL